MAVFAIIQGGIVANVIVADAWPGGINITNMSPRPAPGWTYNGSIFAPPAPVPDPTTTRITWAGWLERMTEDEWGRYEALLASNLRARWINKRAETRGQIDMSKQYAIDFVTALRQAGVFTTNARAQAMLAPEPLSSEFAVP